MRRRHPLRRSRPLRSARRAHADLAKVAAFVLAFPKPRARIKDPACLRWVRSLDCLSCPPGEQRTQTEPHHYGPRGLGRLCHDWLTVPLCRLCHRRFHRWGTLPGWETRAEAVLFVLAEQVRLVTRFHAPLLAGTVEQWHRLAAEVNWLPSEERRGHLRQVLDQLVDHLAADQLGHAVHQLPELALLTELRLSSVRPWEGGADLVDLAVEP